MKHLYLYSGLCIVQAYQEMIHLNLRFQEVALVCRRLDSN